MAIIINAQARRQIREIRKYSEKTWGEKQAEKYVDGLLDFIRSLEKKKYKWREVPRDYPKTTFVSTYKKHVIFFNVINEHTIGVVLILHHRQDFPMKISEILYETH